MVMFDGMGGELCAQICSLGRPRRNCGAKIRVSHGKRSARRPEIPSVRGLCLAMDNLPCYHLQVSFPFLSARKTICMRD
jgi:hypothetical protein